MATDIHDIIVNDQRAGENRAAKRLALFEMLAASYDLDPTGEMFTSGAPYPRPDYTNCECTEDVKDQIAASEAEFRARDSSEAIDLGAKLQKLLMEATIRAGERGDYWDEGADVSVCGRCGRMWDGS
jgi:hypothetical protein